MCWKKITANWRLYIQQHSLSRRGMKWRYLQQQNKKTNLREFTTNKTPLRRLLKDVLQKEGSDPRRKVWDMRISGEKGSGKTKVPYPIYKLCSSSLDQGHAFEVLPFISYIINILVSTRSFPHVSKHAILSSIKKKIVPMSLTATISCFCFPL